MHRFDTLFQGVQHKSGETAMNYIDRFRQVQQLAEMVGNHYSDGTLVDLFMFNFQNQGVYTPLLTLLDEEWHKDEERLDKRVPFAKIEARLTELDKKQSHNKAAKVTALATEVQCSYCQKRGHVECDCRKKQ